MKRQKYCWKKNIVGYSFIMPAIIGFVFFMAYPLLKSLYMSFMNWNMFKGESGSEWIGLKNYQSVLTNEYFQTGLGNNILLALMGVPILLLLSMIIATLLNEKMYGRGILRAMYFVPYITTVTAAALVFSAIFHPEFGPINSLLRMLGVNNVPGWATSVKTALPTIAIFWIWKNVGYCIVIFLSGLQGISRSYYEAASIDGATKIQQFFKITMPLVSPTTFFLAITTVIASFQIFPEVQVITQGGPGTATTTLVYHIYDMAFKQFNMGYASAVSWIFFALLIIITIIQWVGQKKWVNYM
ncbi:sugar ABC transporter permease [Faecalicatena contorta]|uniref:carbohydrate ABC transporter permease n=1 Tax=Faecalicatena contorta TaxID=39482 RepID=UPI00129D4A49|nr:sugar ABC transporter permease [Faecalicatena contorta]MRM88990.1 sugar ABC transporter permease [Faecalicatena contorta]